MIIFRVPFDSGAFSEKGSALAPGLLVPDGVPVDVVPDNIEETHENIFAAASREKSFFACGGDHSISYPLIRAFFKNHPGGVVLYFDAHADADTELMPPSYEDVVIALVKHGFVNSGNFAYVGLCKVWDNEKSFIGHYNLKSFEPKMQEEILEFVGGRPLYVSFDIDVFSKEFAPGTGHPDGMASPGEIIPLLKKLRIVCADLVEVNPRLDVGGRTVGLAKEIISILVSSF